MNSPHVPGNDELAIRDRIEREAQAVERLTVLLHLRVERLRLLLEDTLPQAPSPLVSVPRVLGSDLIRAGASPATPQAVPARAVLSNE